MKNLLSISLLLLILIPIFECKQKNINYLTVSDRSISSMVDGIKYESGNWSHPDYSKPFKSLGNHRFIIQFKGKGETCLAEIPRRRADIDPSKKNVVIINAKSKLAVRDILIKKITNESGVILFKSQKGSDLYYVYYLPHESTGSYYPKLNYTPQSKSEDSVWQQKYKKYTPDELKKLPKAEIIAAQSIDDFHSFYPMEIIATNEEINKMLLTDKKEFYLFPEYRKYPIRMVNYLPKHWIDRGRKSGISDNAKKGEFYTFQIGIYSPHKQLKDLKISYTDFNSERGGFIPKLNIHSFNSEGTDLKGRPFSKTVNIKKGSVQPLWFGVDIPEKIKKGKYTGRIIINAIDIDPKTIYIKLNILDEIISNHGDDKPENMTRLRWLNSRIGSDKTFIAKPFTPVIINGNALTILGREIILGTNGLPEKIKSFFASEMTYLKANPEPIVDAPFTFNVLGKNKKKEEWRSKGYKIEQSYKSEAHWNVLNESDNFNLRINGSLEYDGTLNYQIELTSKKDQEVSDILLEIPMDQDAAEMMVGLGRKGGKRPDKFLWKWDVNYHQEGAWMGNVNKGLQYVLRDNKYERPLNTNFYHNKPLILPESWGNNGKGGIRISKKDNFVILENFSGGRVIKKGKVLHFNIRLLITPFKVIDIKKHFSTRFVHKYVPVEEAEELGGSVINVHHANVINPYINYPFYNLSKQTEYIQKAHKRGIKVKLYNTIRELSYKAYELFAMRSLGNEIFNDGKGGGHSWLQEHLRSGYHSAWHATNVNDAAILNKGTSRWTNYYIEGLNWLAKNQKIDGIYLDDIAFDRDTTKRIISVLSKHRDEIIIDLHSANQYNKRDGFINSIFLYMEHIPYVSRLWFGEYFNYDEDPDYWLTEVSGIPFGLTGEMLEKGGHPYRGMVFGMTSRVYGEYNPGALWDLFDLFDIKNSKMFGYWLDNSPVKISEKELRSTIYLHSNRILIAIGSWSDEDKNIKLDIDWKMLGFDKKKTSLFSPQISGLQKKKKFNPELSIKIEKNRGLILILEDKSHR